MTFTQEQVLDLAFRQARTHRVWQEKPVEDELLHRLYDVFKMGPTSVNSCPGRFVFVKSVEEKEKLKPALSPGNVDQTMTAPVTVIMAYDTRFYDHLDRLYPVFPAKTFFEGPEKEAYAEKSAAQNATLQHAYLIVAARLLGLDAGPMAGFDARMVDRAFFKGTTWKTAMLCNLGYGDTSKLYPRGPRFAFEEVCKIL